MLNNFEIGQSAAKPLRVTHTGKVQRLSKSTKVNLVE